MKTPLLTLRIQSQRDVVLARQRARQIAGLLSFSPRCQTALGAAVFELALHVARRGGSLQFELRDDALHVIPHLTTGAASGHGRETRRWTNRLPAREGRENAPPLRLVEPLPDQARSPAREDLSWLIAQLTRHTPLSLFEEICQQNRELLRALQELEAGRVNPVV